MSMENFFAWVQSAGYDKPSQAQDLYRHRLQEHDGEYMTAAQKKKAEKGKSTPEWYKGQYVDGKWKETTRADVERQRKDYDKSH